MQERIKEKQETLILMRNRAERGSLIRVNSFPKEAQSAFGAWISTPSKMKSINHIVMQWMMFIQNEDCKDVFSRKQAPSFRERGLVAGVQRAQKGRQEVLGQQGKTSEKKSGKKCHPRLMSILALSEAYNSYREASTGGFRKRMDLIYMWNLYGPVSFQKNEAF